MRSIKSSLATKSLTVLLAGAMIWTLSFVDPASAQRRAGIIDAGNTIVVRTNESIYANDSDGRIYSGVVDQDVVNRGGYVAIPRGSDVELIVRRVSNTDVALDLDAVMINGQRYGIEAESNVLNNTDQREGLGINDRTGKYVGGGALLGAVIGAITGGGKGAAIGAGAGAAAGAGAQVLTRGRRVNVPAETLLTYRLAQPLRAGMVDNGYMNNGVHYHQGYQSQRTNNTYNTYNSQQDSANYNNSGRVTIRRDKNISWQAPNNGASVYVQVDNQAPKLFASGQSGTQPAPWIVDGHRYIFILRDANGSEIARDEQDLRPVRSFRYR